MYFWLSLLFAIGFAIIHMCSKYLNFIKETPRSRFLSVAGGVAVAYVFVHLLPELNHYQQNLNETLKEGVGRYIENHIYLIAMIGLAMFYGLERMIKISKKKQKNFSHTSPGVFWIHVSSFFIYNAVIGYLLVRDEFRSGWEMLFYFIALSIHFITNDRGLRRDHKNIYDKYGRILLALSTLIGWGIGVITEVHEVTISVLVAFLAGGIVLNVMKEELPEERESSFSAFAIGIVSYTLLLMLA